MKLLIYIALLFAFSNLCFSQNIDSLKAMLNKRLNDTTRCSLLNQLAENAPDSEWPQFNKELKQTSKKLIEKSSNNKSLQTIYYKYYAMALNNEGYLANQQSNLKAAICFYKEASKIQEQINDLEGLVSTYNNLGLAYKNSSQTDSAFIFYNKSLTLAVNQNNKKLMALGYNNLGFLHKVVGNIPEAINCLSKSLKLREELNDIVGLAQTLGNIGIIYDDLESYSRALQYYINSKAYWEKSGDKYGLSTAESNIGIAYQHVGNFTAAELQFKKGLEIQQTINDPRGKALLQNNLGSVYIDLKKYNAALDLFKSSYNIRKLVGDKVGMIYSRNNMARVLLLSKTNASGLKEACLYSEEAYKIATEIGFPDEIASSARILKEIYHLLGNDTKSLAMFEMHIAMTDSVDNQKNRNIAQKQQFKYEWEKREAQLKAEQEKADAIALEEKQQQRLVLVFVTSGVLLVLVFSLFLYRKFKMTQDQSKIIEEQKKEVDKAFEHLHEKNKEVMDSIIYAKRIQQALLTSERYIGKHINKLANTK